MKKKLTAFILTILILFSAFSLTSSAYDRNTVSETSSIYSKALSLAGRRSFHGNCNLATAYQLMARGIYSGGLDYSGSGDLWYNHFSGVSKTSGGYNVVTVKGRNCLYNLIEKYGSPIYDIVYSLGTGGTSGSKHVLYIRAIIDGYVYFADSFDCSYGGYYYPEGACTVLSVDKFVSSYRSMNGNPHGCVYFVKNQVNSGQNSVSDSSDTEYVKGKYIITASALNIRKDANISSKAIGLVPNGATVNVTEVKNAWGKITYNGNTGWISLEYALKMSSGESDTEKDITNELIAVYLTADKSAVKSGDTITWSAAAAGSGGKFLYSFEIFLDGESIYKSEYRSDASFSYTAEAVGTYQAFVTITDEQNNEAQLYGDSVECTDSDEIIMGDVDGNGKINSVDARLALRIASKAEKADSGRLRRSDMNNDNSVTSSDARKILRISAKLE